MKKISRILVILLMMFMIGGCGNNDCNCPVDNTSTEGKYTTTITDYSELYSNTVQSIVLVRVQRKNNKSQILATGSGVVFFEEGESAYVLTNAHVLRGVTTDYEVEIVFSDNKGFPSGESEIATIMGRDFKEDVAVLEINKSSKYKVATIGNSDNISRGDFVYTIGSPLAKFNYTTSGNISTYNSEIDIDSSKIGVSTTVYMIMFDAAINEGNSGGALFNDKGEVIGITTLKYDDYYGLYGALPINYFVKVAKYLMAHTGDYVRPSLNLSLLSIDEMGTRREDYEISSYVSSGVYVQSSLESNIAGQSVIVAINGKTIKSRSEYGAEILKYSVGDAITLTLVNKDGLNTRTVSVTLHV